MPNAKKQNKVEETEIKVVPYDSNWPLLFVEANNTT
jgi:hypothetical protein